MDRTLDRKPSRSTAPPQASNPAPRKPKPKAAASPPVNRLPADSFEFKGREWDRNVPAGLSTDVAGMSPVANNTQSFLFKNLALPAEKGDVLDFWRRYLPRIQAAVDREGIVKERTFDTSDKRSSWLQKVGWTDRPDERWRGAVRAAGYIPANAKGVFEPKLRERKGGKVITCDLDHIIELQFLGTNAVENFQCLDPDANRSSGSQLKNLLGNLAARVRPYSAAKTFFFQFENVTQPTPYCGPGCLVNELALNGVEQAEGSDDVTYVHADPNAKLYDLVGSIRTQVELETGEEARNRIQLRASGNDRNMAAATLIPGLWLEQLRLSRDMKMDKVDFSIDTTFRWPFTVKSPKGQDNVLKVKERTHELMLESGNPSIKIFYPYLSPGTITRLSYDPETGLSGSGTLTPSIPILRNLVFGFDFTPDSLVFTTGLDEQSLKKISGPLPRTDITEASLMFMLWPDFVPSGRIGFAVGPADRRFLTGLVKASADANGFRLDGMVMANIPRVDNAMGVLSYSNKKWSGQIGVSSSQIKIPGYRSGSIQGRLERDEFKFSGDVELAFPIAGREQIVMLSLDQRRGGFLFAGKASLDLPRVEDAELDVTYDGEKLEGRGSGSISVGGLKGTLSQIDFSLGPDGKPVVSGMGMVSLGNNRRAQGSVNVNLSRRGRFSGSGMIRYKVSESLTAEGRVVLDENEKLRVEGALRLRRIELFPAVAGERELFRIPRVRIPVPQASIAGYGVVLTLDAGVSASYSFGAGALEDVSLTAAVSPLEQNSDFSAQIAGRLVVPAAAGLTARVRGGLGLDAALASATGGVTLSGEARLRSQAAVAFSGAYEKGRYQIQATPMVMGNLDLGFGVTGDVRVDLAGQEVYRRAWSLARYSYPSALQFGVMAMIGYDSANGFKPPSITSLQFTRPPFELGGLLDRLL